MLLTEDTLDDSVFSRLTEQPQEHFDFKKYAADEVSSRSLRRSLSQPTLKAPVVGSALTANATLRSSLNSLFEDKSDFIDGVYPGIKKTESVICSGT